MNFEQNSKALRHWVTESTRSNKLEGNALTIERRVQNLLNASVPLKSEIIVYRGHSPDAPKIFSYSWFSTSDDVTKVKRQHIADRTTCCLFKLHILPGIRVIYVDDIIKTAGLKKTGYVESEIIVDRNGYFYADKDLTSEGFHQIEDYDGITQYEAWYSTKAPPKVPPKAQPKIEKLSVEQILEKIDKIPADEIEFVDTLEDLVSFEYIKNTNSANLSNTNKNIIQAHITSKKGGSRHKISRKTRKARKVKKTRKIQR
jgi:hypothetical protein